MLMNAPVDLAQFQAIQDPYVGHWASCGQSQCTVLVWSLVLTAQTTSLWCFDPLMCYCHFFYPLWLLTRASVLCWDRLLGGSWMGLAALWGSFRTSISGLCSALLINHQQLVHVCSLGERLASLASRRESCLVFPGCLPVWWLLEPVQGRCCVH